MKENLKYKLAESFCRNFALQSRNIAKTVLAVSIESKEWIWVDEKIHSTFFVKQKNENARILAGRSHELRWSSDVIGHK